MGYTPAVARFLHLVLCSLVAILVPLPPAGAGTNYYVATNGLDIWPGTLAQPFPTIQKAANTAQAGDTVHIREGVYRETVIPANSGTVSNPIVFKAFVTNGVTESVTVSGFDVITPGANGAGLWTQHQGNIYSIQLTNTWAIDIAEGNDFVLLDGEPMIPARWPNVTYALDFDYTHKAAADGGWVDTNTLGSQGMFGPNFYTGGYSDSDLDGFGTNDWKDAFVDLNTGYGWWMHTGVVTGSAPGSIEFRWKYNLVWIPIDDPGWYSVEDPQNGDPYFLWGKLIALDQEREYFYDVRGNSGPAHVLYLWPTGGGCPSNRTVELRVREEAFDLSSRAHVRIEGLRTFGSGIMTDSNSSGVSLADLTLEYAALHRSTILAGSCAAVTFFGNDHSIVDSDLSNGYGCGIEIRATNTIARNNVCYNFSDIGIRCQNATQVTVANNTAIRAGASLIMMNVGDSTFASNHVYWADIQTTDASAMNACNVGDGQGTEVAYNWVHDNVGRWDLSRDWYGGQGIRLDMDSSNYRIHHNIVWNTTAYSSLTVWELVPGDANYSNSQTKIYHNTVDWDIVIHGDTNSTPAGTDIRNNIARGFREGADGSEGAVVSNNLFAFSSVNNNLTGNPSFSSAWNANFGLSSNSPALDAGVVLPPYTDGYVGAAPDLGALERGSPPRIAGRRHPRR